MKRFSDRMGITKPKILQIESMDDSLKNAIWNFIYEEILNYGNLLTATTVLARDFFNDRVHNLNERYYLPEKYQKMEWWEIYNLFEFCTKNYLKLRGFDSFPTDPMHSWTLNDQMGRMLQRAERILEEQNSGYRFIGGELCPITNILEIEEIEETLKQTKHGFEGARQHIKKAIEFLSKKPKPDFQNSIKESISAVESVASLIAGQDKANLGLALKTLKKKSIDIHPAMEQAFIQLFGYSSDENGIRHAILDKSKPGFDEAKFMAVACSAFVNFLILKREKTS